MKKLVKESLNEKENKNRESTSSFSRKTGYDYIHHKRILEELINFVIEDIQKTNEKFNKKYKTFKVKYRDSSDQFEINAGNYNNVFVRKQYADEIKIGLVIDTGNQIADYLKSKTKKFQGHEITAICNYLKKLIENKL